MDNIPESPRFPQGMVEKRVQMPKREEMAERLEQAGVMGISSQSDEVFSKFAQGVADRRIVGSGLSLKWSLNMHEVLADRYPPMVRNLVDCILIK